jgi:fructose-bisphosphate aldolase class II
MTVSMNAAKKVIESYIELSGSVGKAATQKIAQ